MPADVPGGYRAAAAAAVVSSVTACRAEEDTVVDGRRTRPASRSLARWITLAAAFVMAVAASGCTVLTDGLAGSSFVLTAVNEKVPLVQYVVPPEDIGRYGIAFVNDGTATITADCNQVSATYTTTRGGGLSIRPGASTLAECPDDSLGQQFVGALSLVTSYNVHGGSMTMYLGNEGHMDFRLQN